MILLRYLRFYLRFARPVFVGLVIVGLLGAVAKLFHAVVFTHGVRNAVFASVIWGALLLLSFTGWGTALNTWLFPRQRADFGLRCAWGWGIAVALGGLGCALGLAKRRV